MSSTESLKRNADTAGLDLESDDEDKDLVRAKNKHFANEKGKANMAKQCPYLDTINRNVLDFGKFFSYMYNNSKFFLLIYIFCSNLKTLRSFVP